MHSSVFHKTIILLAISLSITGSSILYHHLKTSTTIVFCDVGQGDATYIRVQNRIDILIDAGPNSAVTSCLGSNMPFYDRTIELAIVTHPQKDHFYGFIPILNHYHIKTIYLPALTNDSKSYQALLTSLKQTKTSVHYAIAPSNITAGPATITFLWPTDPYLTRFGFNGSEPFHSSVDPNAISTVILYNEGYTNLLLTGDAPVSTLESLVQFIPDNLSLIKLAHHGSITGTSSELVETIQPKMAVISVGQKNRYRHPSSEVVAMLQSLSIPTYRTDVDGTVIFRIDKKRRLLQKEKKIFPL